MYYISDIFGLVTVVDLIDLSRLQLKPNEELEIQRIKEYFQSFIEKDLSW